MATTSLSRIRYSGTCGDRACPTYSPCANCCHGIMPRASQPTSPQPQPAALSTPQIGNGAAKLIGWQDCWAFAVPNMQATPTTKHSATMVNHRGEVGGRRSGVRKDILILS